MHWFVGGSAANINSNNTDPLYYDYWWTDATHTTNQLVSGGMPTVGDNVYSDSLDTALIGNIGGTTWTGVNFVTSFNMSDTNYSATLTLDAACTMQSGVVLTDTYGGSATLNCAASWIGDISIQNFQAVTLSPGWKVKNGAAGGNIDVESSEDTNITVQAPGAGQVNNYNHITLSGNTNGTYLDTSAWGNINLTGTITLGYLAITTPGGNWVVLNSSSANAFGCSVGHVPAIINVLPSDNLFGVTGTAAASTGGTGFIGEL